MSQSVKCPDCGYKFSQSDLAKITSMGELKQRDEEQIQADDAAKKKWANEVGSRSVLGDIIREGVKKRSNRWDDPRERRRAFLGQSKR